jgi:hypothetical protein
LATLDTLCAGKIEIRSECDHEKEPLSFKSAHHC